MQATCLQARSSCGFHFFANSAASSKASRAATFPATGASLEGFDTLLQHNLSLHRQRCFLQFSNKQLSARCKLLSDHSQAPTCFRPPPLCQALLISLLPPAVLAGPTQADQMSVYQEWLHCQLRALAYLLSKVAQTCNIPYLQPVSSFPPPHIRP